TQVPSWWLHDSSTVYPVSVDPSFVMYSSTGDGDLRYSDASYTVAHDALVAEDLYTTGNTLYVGQRAPLSIPAYVRIYRSYLYFNTSLLPDFGVTLQSNLTFYRSIDASEVDFDLVLQNGQPGSPHLTLAKKDYYYGNYSGNGGSFNTGSLGGGGVPNVIELNMVGKGWINKTGWTKLCLRSSRDINDTEPPFDTDEYISLYSGNYNSYKPKLTVVCTDRNQSKIVNTGETNISGYVLVQVQFYNESLEDWVVADDTVNETVPRRINVSSQFGLDTVFNGSVNTDDLVSFGSGLYRVYAMFRDPVGNMLVNDDESVMAAWYEFTIDFT
ncbi:MAG: hypothetical protein V1726_03665, partial [Methanobacteriota archaeon]